MYQSHFVALPQFVYGRAVAVRKNVYQTIAALQCPYGVD